MQHTVSCSSAIPLCELKWLRRLLHDLQALVTGPILLHCDDYATIYIAANSIFHERIKYIEIDYHFV